MATNIVPNDMWICHECEGTNLISTAPKKCPTCSHCRCGSCYGPGAQRPPPREGMSLEQEDFRRQRRPLRASSHYTPNRRARNSYGMSNISRRERLQAPSPNASLPTAPKDLWICSQCNEENHNWLDFCPICGAPRPQ